ncbi:hypothetical protein HY933_01865 [Candidatus Falkowbacteria bacterium]|nr:hypothetical protein [Candidatus Falkowbacteria bacterium]
MNPMPPANVFCRHCTYFAYYADLTEAPERCPQCGYDTLEASPADSHSAPGRHGFTRDIVTHHRGSDPRIRGA